jgi:hypothetical protein
MHALHHFLLLLVLLLGLPGCGEDEPVLEQDETQGAEPGGELEAWIPEGHEWVGDWNSLVEEVRRDLAASTGQDQSELRFLLTDSERVAEVLERNIDARFADGEESGVPTSAIKQLSQALLGIYDLEKDVVHIALDHFVSMSEAINMPELRAREVVYAVMVHEGAHSFADTNFDLTKLFTEAQALGSVALTCAEAVCEGHAQYLARKTCVAANRLEGFEIFTQAITEIPDGLEVGERALVEMNVRAFDFAYGHGETFVEAVIADGGSSAEQRIFSDPPRTRTEILRPAWYLDPESRPEHGFALDEALELVPDAFAEVRGIQFTKNELTGGDLAEANATAMGKERAEEMGALLEVCQIQIGMVGQGDKMVYVSLMATADEATADRFLDFAQEASDAKDEAFRNDGFIKILSSETMQIDPELGIGMDQVKRISVNDQEAPLRSLMVRRGRLIVEITLSNLMLPDGEAEALADQLLRRAMLEDE